MNNKIITLVLTILVLDKGAFSQEQYIPISGKNMPEEIIYKAAHIVPSDRQYRWQTLELTAFLHFGINTFTDREWGTGQDSIELFKPKALNAEQWIKTLKV